MAKQIWKLQGETPSSLCVGRLYRFFPEIMDRTNPKIGMLAGEIVRLMTLEIDGRVWVEPFIGDRPVVAVRPESLIRADN